MFFLLWILPLPGFPPFRFFSFTPDLCLEVLLIPYSPSGLHSPPYPLNPFFFPQCCFPPPHPPSALYPRRHPFPSCKRQILFFFSNPLSGPSLTNSAALCLTNPPQCGCYLLSSLVPAPPHCFRWFAPAIFVFTPSTIHGFLFTQVPFPCQLLR